MRKGIEIEVSFIHEMSLLEHLKACQERVTAYILSLTGVSSDPISERQQRR